jgi:lipopolysaccharide/colanic/teichoic acid biosynthesis glycosyltransferase
VASALGLLIGLPLIAAIALAIKLDSRGPVFFVQRRCGKGGREFPMAKFRTMSTDAESRKAELADRNEAEGPMYKIRADPRVTRVGRLLRKTSLDELPQLWNVLRGEMSLVGPRPLIMEEMSWSPKWRDIRLEVKPGITGPWQVYARNEPGFRSWIEHDIDYVRNRSFATDLHLLALTAGTLVGKGRGV